MKENTEKKVNFVRRFNLLSKIFCILAAFLIWLYVTAVESPDHEETVSFVTIEIVGEGTIQSEHNLSVVSGKDNKIDLVVKGQQSTIAKYDVEDYSITADISGIDAAGRYTVALSFDMPTGVTLSSASSNTVEVYVDEQISAEVEVRPSVTYSSEYTVGDYQLDYDVITVSGPKKLVNEIGYAEVSVNAGKISSTTTYSGKLTLKNTSNAAMSSSYFKLSKDEVKVTIPVYVTKEVEVRVPFKYDYYKADTATVNIEPSSVIIEGDPSVLSTVKYVNTTMVNEKDITDNTSLSLALQIPESVSLSKLEKDTVSISIQHIGTQKKYFSISSENINVIGAEKLKYEILNNSVNITVRGDSDVLKTITQDDFRISIDLTGYDSSSAVVEVPYSVDFGAESYKAYVVGANDENVKVKIG